jgi:hypothetical protein
MAFTVRLTGYDRETNAATFELEPPWWPERALRQDPRFRISTDGNCYLDYDADLSVAEAREMHKQLRSRAEEGVFADPTWQDTIRPMLATLELAFGARAAEFSHFHVRVFEWESGLD